MKSRDEYESKLDAASSESRHDPLRDAAHRAVTVWMAEDEMARVELSDDFWKAMGDLAAVLVSKKRGEPQEVPYVEVTYDPSRIDEGETFTAPESGTYRVTQTESPVYVEASERPLERRRSGAKNVSAPEYQKAFIEESRAVMGQPSVEDAEALVGKYVKLTFNIDWHPVEGVLTQVNQQEPQPPYLLLDNYRERRYPLYTIQSIQVVP